MMAVSPSVRNDLYNISSRWAGDEVTHEAGICVEICGELLGS